MLYAWLWYITLSCDTLSTLINEVNVGRIMQVCKVHSRLICVSSPTDGVINPLNSDKITLIPIIGIIKSSSSSSNICWSVVAAQKRFACILTGLLSQMVKNFAVTVTTTRKALQQSDYSTEPAVTATLIGSNPFNFKGKRKIEARLVLKIFYDRNVQ